MEKNITLTLTEGELNVLTSVLDNDEDDLLDGWEYLQKSDPKAWEKKLNDLKSAKEKIFNTK